MYQPNYGEDINYLKLKYHALASSKSANAANV